MTVGLDAVFFTPDRTEERESFENDGNVKCHDGNFIFFAPLYFFWTRAKIFLGNTTSGVIAERTSCPMSWRTRIKNVIFNTCFFIGMDKRKDPILVHAVIRRFGIDRIASPINVRNDSTANVMVFIAG